MKNMIDTDRVGFIRGTTTGGCSKTSIFSNYPFNHEQDKSWLSPSLGINGGVIY